MAILKVKIIRAQKAANVKTAIDAYLTAQTLSKGLRGMRTAAVKAEDGDTEVVVAVAHGGKALPAATAQLAPLQTIVVEGGNVAKAQTLLDAALAACVADTDAAGNANTNAGEINVGVAMFEAADVGTRKVRIAGQTRDITVFTSSTRVTYSGAPITGTGLLVELLGADVLQPGTLSVDVFKGNGGENRVVVSCAVNGEALA